MGTKDTETILAELKAMRADMETLRQEDAALKAAKVVKGLEPATLVLPWKSGKITFMLKVSHKQGERVHINPVGIDGKPIEGLEPFGQLYLLADKLDKLVAAAAK